MGVRRVIGGVVLVLVGTTGCTHALSRAMPDVQGRVAVRVSNEPPSTMSEMPLGVYRIGETSVYVSGHQGAAGIGAAFGIIGLAAAHAAAQSTGEKKTKDTEAQLRLDIAKLTGRVLAEEVERLADWSRFAPGGGPGDAWLEVVPYLVVNFVGNDQVRP